MLIEGPHRAGLEHFYKSQGLINMPDKVPHRRMGEVRRNNKQDYNL